MGELVFGYASLVADAVRPARVAGWRREWGVAMDNREAIPGYKRYLDPATRAAPAVHVAFADLVEDPAGVVDGGVLEVADLAVLDARERNYVRIEVVTTDGERAWTYVGSPAGRARFTAAPQLVVARAYLEAAGLDAAGLEVLDLERVDL